MILVPTSRYSFLLIALFVGGLLPFGTTCLAQETTKIASLELISNKIDTFRRLKQGDSALHYARIGLPLAQELQEDSLAIKMHYALGNYENESLTTTLDHLDEAERLAVKYKDWNMLGRTYYSIADKFYSNDDDKNALRYFLKLDSFAEKKQYDKYMWAMAKVSISDILLKAYSEKDTIGFTQINRYLEDGLKISDSFNLDVPAAILLEKKANYHRIKGETNEALRYFQAALDTANKSNNYLRQSSIYNGLGNLYAEKGQLDDALAYYLQEIEAVEKWYVPVHKAVAHYRIGKFYASLSKPELGVKHLEIAQNILQNEPNVRLRQKYDIEDALATIYENKGHYKKAFEASQKSKELLSEMQHNINEANVTELEKKYQVHKKEQQIELLKIQKDLSEEQKANQRNFFLIITFIITSGVAILYVLSRNRKKTNRKLKELDKFKTKLFANISHEFRTPLTLILGPIERKLAMDEVSDTEKNELRLIQRNSNRLLELVDQLLDITKLESGNLTLRIAQNDLGVFLQQIVGSFRYKAEEKQLQFSPQISSIKNAWFDKDVVEKIVTNLVSNAFKYTPSGGKIVIDAKNKDGYLVLTIVNSGTILSEDKLSKIFERFYQEEPHTEGVGIGLALVKELCTLSHGHVIANTINGEEIQFTVSLPIERSFFKEAEVATNETHATSKNGTHSETDQKLMAKKEDKPILLIIDDEADIRKFIASIFEDEYSVKEASNGETGIELAIKLIPDLIISDVMMPILDGIAVCNTLKKNSITSHIPIILLTAKAGDTNEIEGLLTGADDYITKPFNSKKLQVRVEKLIELRRQLQERYTQEFEFDFPSAHTETTEQKFIQELHAIMNENIGDSNFKTEQLCTKMLMSRMQLHRKLKAISGMSTSEFLKLQRVKLASKLLKETDLSISEIGYEVGFSSPSYFNRCFKEVYHCSPKSYR